jgi:hypothetical protein
MGLPPLVVISGLILVHSLPFLMGCREMMPCLASRRWRVVQCLLRICPGWPRLGWFYTGQAGYRSAQRKSRPVLQVCDKSMKGTARVKKKRQASERKVWSN